MSVSLVIYRAILYSVVWMFDVLAFMWLCEVQTLWGVSLYGMFCMILLNVKAPTELLFGGKLAGSVLPT